jgi:hypothetical protein
MVLRPSVGLVIGVTVERGCSYGTYRREA